MNPNKAANNSSKLEAIYTNLGDSEHYLSTIKQGLLFFDKLWSFPVLDMICTTLLDLHKNVIEPSTRKVPTLAKKQIKKVKKKAKRNPWMVRQNPAKLDEFLRHNCEVAANEYVHAQAEKKFNQSIKVKGKILQSLEDELKPAVDEGLITYRSPELNQQSLVNGLTDVFSKPLIDVYKDYTKQILGGKLKLDITNSMFDPMYLWQRQASILAAELDLPLMTVDRHLMNQIVSNYSELRKSKHVDPVYLERRWKHQQLTLQLNKLELPNLSELPMDDILEIRYVAGDLLNEYRQRMKYFSSTLRRKPWDDEFEHESSAMIEDDIIPILNDVQKVFSESPSLIKIFSNAIKRGASVKGSLDFIATIFPLPEMLLFALAGTITLGQTLVNNFYSDCDMSINNGFIFLMRAKTIHNIASL